LILQLVGLRFGRADFMERALEEEDISSFLAQQRCEEWRAGGRFILPGISVVAVTPDEGALGRSWSLQGFLWIGGIDPHRGACREAARHGKKDRRKRYNGATAPSRSSGKIPHHPYPNSV
jgi:hypothetical protein